MGLNTKIIYQGTLTQNMALDKKKNYLNYIIITKMHVFMYKNQNINNQVSAQTLRKIIPYIEEEFFLI